MQTTAETFDIKPYSTKELCLIYGVSDKTFARWIKPFKEDIGKRSGRYYTVLQVELIISRLGMPYVVRA